MSTIVLNVKLLGSSAGSNSSKDVSVEACPTDSVENLKSKLEKILNLNAEDEQKLLFKGKTLQDGTNLESYFLQNGSKLHLMIKSNPVTTKSLDCNTNNISDNHSVNSVLFKALRKHFKSDEDTNKIIDAFKKDFGRRLDRLNLDDIERISKKLNEENVIHF